MNSIFEIIAKLERAKIHFTLSRIREESILIIVAVPGERWEIEVMEDGTVETEVFVSKDGVETGTQRLDDLFEKHSRD